jgi:hypothetical protein
MERSFHYLLSMVIVYGGRLWSSPMVVVYGLWPLCLLDVDAFEEGGVVVFDVIVTALLQASQRVLDPLPVFHSRMNRN